MTRNRDLIRGSLKALQESVYQYAKVPYVITEEINLKQAGGNLQHVTTTLLDHTPFNLLIFNAVSDANPDGYQYAPDGVHFYDNDGTCCYTLAEKFAHSKYTGITDTQDNRGNIEFLLSSGFTWITTDEVQKVESELSADGLRNTSYYGKAPAAYSAASTAAKAPAFAQ